MTGRQLAALMVLAGVVSGCAARSLAWLDVPVVDDYAAVRVRIYRAGPSCRVEIITRTDTIMTPPTRCLTVAHRHPGGTP